MKAQHWSGDIPASDEEARDRIVRAAVDLAEERGLHRINIKLIAQNAGVSRTTVYAYFPSKEAILAYAFTQSARYAADIVQAQLRTRTTAHDMLVEAAFAGIRFVEADRLLSLALRRDFISGFVPGTVLGQMALENVGLGLSPLFEAFPHYLPKRLLIAEILSRVVLSIVTVPSPQARTDAELRAFLSICLGGVIAP